MKIKFIVLLILFGTGLFGQPVLPWMPMTGIDYIKKFDIKTILYSEGQNKKADTATTVLLEYNQLGLIVKTKEMNGALATQTLSYLQDWSLKDWKRFDKSGKVIDFAEKENYGDTLYTYNSPKRKEKRRSIVCNGIPFIKEEIITENGKITSSKKYNYTSDCRQSKTVFYWGGNGQKNETVQEMIEGYIRPVKKTYFDSTGKITNVIRYYYGEKGSTSSVKDSSANGVKEVVEEIPQLAKSKNKTSHNSGKNIGDPGYGPIGNPRRAKLQQTEYKAVTYDEKGMLRSYEYYVDWKLDKKVELTYTFN